jgi:hypothetical protein
MRNIDVADMYGILLTPDNAESGKAFIEELMNDVRATDAPGNANALLYLKDYLGDQFAEGLAIIGFAREQREACHFDLGAQSLYARHQINRGIMLLSWTSRLEIDTNIKERITDTLTRIVAMFEADDGSGNDV